MRFSVDLVGLTPEYNLRILLSILLYIYELLTPISLFNV